jgi:hypothetical protein
MLEGDRVVAVELAPAGERDGRRAEAHRRAQLICSAQPAGEIAVAVLVAARRAEAVDAGRALEPDRAGEARLVQYQRPGCARPSEAEGPALGCGGIARLLVGTVDGDHSADRFRAPQRRLRSTNDLDPRSDVGIQKLETRGVARCGIIGADAVDEQQGVIGFRAADPDLRQRAGGPRN